MKQYILLLAAILGVLYSSAQQQVRLIIKDKANGTPLAGATVVIKKNNTTAIADSAGIATLNNIPAGKQSITISVTGYEETTLSLSFPVAENEISVTISVAEEVMEEVVIQSTRTSRTIANTPTRVETIDAEEVDEKNNMRPANVSMLLHESTGLQVQQTSATSANASIRMQGLDGRYTQLLKDGYPNFGNFASGLSILEIPPLDLKQVEIIKGPASTLYGGGAIAGVINFISKTPKEKGEYNLLLNQSNIGQTNIGAYAAKKNNKWGYAVLGLLNFQKAYDVDKDHFSELPKSNSFTINPRLFFYPSAGTAIMIGNSFTKSKNTGGDMSVIDSRPTTNHLYFEENETIRNTTTAELEKKWKDGSSLKVKQSLSIFNRKIAIPGYIFSGINYNSFTDASYIFTKQKHTIISGASFVSDKFRQKEVTASYNQDNRNTTAGLYLQDTWDITDRLKLETGLRLDNIRYSNSYFTKTQSFLLPRISALFKITDKLSSRISAGMGYKVPTIFNEQTETMQYRNLLPLQNVTAEKSNGITADLNYSTRLSEALLFSINQLFFFTGIQRPLVLQDNGAGSFFFSNAAKPVYSNGFETNVKFIFRNHFKLFGGYTFIDAKAKYLNGNPYLPLVPGHKLNLALLYEKEGNIKIGFEAYRTGRQYLYNGSRTPAFWELGFMTEKTIRKVALFINFENFTDERQSKYKTVVNGSHTNPSFDDIWNHTEGFVINGGIKIKL